MTAKERYDELKVNLAELKARMQETAGGVLREGLQSVFDQFPEVESIGWHQYTPYFNDGDECVFRVDSDEPNINGESGWDVPYSDELKHLRPAQIVAGRILGSISDDDFKMMFGDHAEVTIYRDGRAEVSVYDHD